VRELDRDPTAIDAHNARRGLASRLGIAVDDQVAGLKFHVLAYIFWSALTSDNCQRTLDNVIVAFSHKGLKLLYDYDDDSKIRPDWREKVKEILSALDAASESRDMNLPGFKLHPLKGDLKGHWGVTVSGNWRVTFRFKDGNATDVNLEDYH
jgi:toxin HigB-1